MTVRQILARNLHVPESPRWRDGELWFVDGPAIRRIDREGHLHLVAQLECPVLLGMAFAPDGSLLTNDATGRCVLRIAESGEVTVVQDLSATCPTMINEVHRFRDGSLLVGEFGFDIIAGEAPVKQQLVLISPDGDVRRHGPEIEFANGMLSLDEGSTVLVAEYFGGSIWRFEQAADGAISDGYKVIADAGTGVDGIAMDPNGAIWFASMPEGYLGRLDAQGCIVEKLETGFGHATSLTFDTATGDAYATVLESLPSPETMGDANGAVVRIRRS